MAVDYTPTLGNYTELKPFRYWCQKVLPLVYDDSLSYYELLCKVVDYLNKTMEDVETLHDDVDNLHTAYEELQTYVNNYFDNLDVQNEINNKLDTMATDGTLSALIQPLLPDIVSTWLAAHITPTTPAVDNTLSVSGAAADAKVTGDRLTILDKNLLPLEYAASNFYWTSGVAHSSAKDTCIISAVSGEKIYVTTTSDQNLPIGIRGALNGTWRDLVAVALTNRTYEITLEADIDTVGIYIGTNGTYNSQAVTFLTEKSDSVFRLINSNTIQITELNKFKNGTLRKVTMEDLDVSTFTASAGSSDWYWSINKTYPAGYIDHFVVYGTDNSIGQKAYIAVYDSVLGKYVWGSDPVTCPSSKTVVIPCGINFEHEIYVFARLPYIAHTSDGSTTKYALMWEFGAWSEGAVFDFTWNDANVRYKFAVECWYNDYINSNDLIYSKAKIKLFAAGDSITAGYPYTEGISRPNYYCPDIKWAAQVGRRLDMDITYGAQSGSGWIYRTDSTAQYAISIADNNNFANYDVAVFAFGTNDYGNNMALGTATDIYPTNETVCGAINYVINKVYTDNPGITLILSTPINRADHGNKAGNYAYGSANTQGYTLAQLVEKMIEICTASGICYIDNRISPFNKYTLTTLLTDTLHPTPAGYKILGSYLATRISEFIYPYTKDMLTVVQK